MSKAIKQMQMDSLNRDFKDVRDMVLLNVVGLNAIAEGHVGADLDGDGQPELTTLQELLP